jgi:predicted transcriptional regulator
MPLGMSLSRRMTGMLRSKARELPTYSNCAKAGFAHRQRMLIKYRFASPNPVYTSSYMSTFTLRVPDDLHKALERQSAALGISKSDLAREALIRYLQVNEFRTLRASLAAPTTGRRYQHR